MDRIVLSNRFNIFKEKIEDYKDILRLTGYISKAYLMSVQSFGKDSITSQDTLKLLKECFSFYLYRHRILNYISKRLTFERLTSLYQETTPIKEYLEDFTEFYENVYLYIIESVEQIEVSAELKLEYKAKRKRFPDLEEALPLEDLFVSIISTEDIAAYFRLNKKKYKKLCNKIIELIPYDESEMAFLGVNYRLNEENILEDIKIYVPEIIDDETLKNNIFEFYLGCQLFSLLNQKVDSEIEQILPLNEEEVERVKRRIFQREKALLFNE